MLKISDYFQRLCSRFMSIFEPKMVLLSKSVEELYKFESKFKSLKIKCPIGGNWLWRDCKDADIKLEYFLSNRGLENFLFSRIGLKFKKISKEKLPSFAEEKESGNGVRVLFNNNATWEGDDIFRRGRITDTYSSYISQVSVKRIDINRIKLRIIKEALSVKWDSFKIGEKDFILYRTKKKDKDGAIELRKQVNRLGKSARRAAKRRDERLRKRLISKGITFGGQHFSVKFID